MPETLSPFGSFAFSLYRLRAAYEGRKEGREGADLKEKGTTGFRDGIYKTSAMPFLLFPFFHFYYFQSWLSELLEIFQNILSFTILFNILYSFFL